jgi:hypothetical protein
MRRFEAELNRRPPAEIRQSAEEPDGVLPHAIVDRPGQANADRPVPAASGDV